ncbi:MAG: 16S rRNA (cytidine(1402)-2'-O)-methyltransferase [Casimicrobiaceae bacterium]
MASLRGTAETGFAVAGWIAAAAGAGAVLTTGAGSDRTRGAGRGTGVVGGVVAAAPRAPDNGAVLQAGTPSSIAARPTKAAWAMRVAKIGIAEGIDEGCAMTRGEPLPAVEGTLYVVATPIGNLRDITLRALDILGQVDVVAAEDTRVTGGLLAHHGIRVQLLSLNEHNERRRAAELVALLAKGKRVALVTDAGTPAISDPGALLVRAVADAGFAVVPVPGPSAVIAALSAAGLAAAHWMFCGFLPATAAARRAVLDALAKVPAALVFYEAPHRVLATLDALVEALGATREIVIARELTKRFETIHRCPLGAAAAWVGADADRIRGEFVLIVAAPDKVAATETSDHDATLALLLAELPLARAVKLATALTGASKNSLYERALALKAASEAAAK